MALFGKKKTEDTSKDAEKKTEPKKSVKKPAKKTDAGKTSMKNLYGDKKAAPDKQAEVKVADEKKTKTHGRAYLTLVKPLITEKASELGKENKYVFEVRYDSNKIEIADAIEEVYNIRPTSVNTVRSIGKKIRSGKVRGRRKDTKKAIVTLPAGKSIKIYEGV